MCGVDLKADAHGTSLSKGQGPFEEGRGGGILSMEWGLSPPSIYRRRIHAIHPKFIGNVFFFFFGGGLVRVVLWGAAQGHRGCQVCHICTEDLASDMRRYGVWVCDLLWA